MPEITAGARELAARAASSGSSEVVLPINARIVSWSHRLATGAGAAAAALGAIVVALSSGMDLLDIRMSLPPSVAMHPYTAVSLLLLGLGLYSLATGAPQRRRWPALTRVGVVLLIGVLALASHATGVNVVRDDMLVGAAGDGQTFGFSIGPALCLTLLGLAQLALVIGNDRAVIVSQVLALLTTLTGLITFDNLLHSVLGPGGGRIPAGWMPPLTALAVTVLALGTLVARPHIGVTQAMTSDSVAGALGRRMLLAALTVPFLLGWTPELAAWLGISGRRFADVLLLTASVVTFGAVSLLATAAAARLEGASIRSAREAQAGHAQLLALIDNTSAVIYIRDLEGRYVLVNREYERLFDVERNKIVGLTDYDLFPREIAEDFFANDKRAVAAEAPILLEEQAPGEDGIHTYITVKFALRDAGGVPYAVCGISTDITDRKRAEAEVQLLNAELENRVRERTEELEASARELDAFAYSVSHDLRAPLRSVDGFSQILLEDYADQLDEQAQDYLRRMRAGTQRMGRLIDDLLKLSRTTRVELRRERVDLSDLARTTIAELRSAHPDRDVTVTIEDGLAVLGDRVLLGLVMENLLSNAWKFTAKREDPRIEVRSVWKDDQLAFQVSDNGAGFDMRYVSKLFGAFERLHSSAEFEGTGIGLATVQRIIRRHGGDVWAEGEPGVGATFTFTLPSRIPAEMATRLEHSY